MARLEGARASVANMFANSQGLQGDYRAETLDESWRKLRYQMEYPLRTASST